MARDLEDQFEALLRRADRAKDPNSATPAQLRALRTLAALAPNFERIERPENVQLVTLNGLQRRGLVRKWSNGLGSIVRWSVTPEGYELLAGF